MLFQGGADLDTKVRGISKKDVTDNMMMWKFNLKTHFLLRLESFSSDVS